MDAASETQSVRLIDVFFLGPFMIWFAYKAHGVPEWARIVMAVSGVFTVIFNGRRYREAAAAAKAANLA